MFGLGPLWSLMIGPRIWSQLDAPAPAPQRVLTNLVLAVRARARSAGSSAGRRGCSSRCRPRSSPARQASGCSTSSTSSRTSTGRAGESWSYADAALRGSSYLKLPKLLQFFTGNIGLHHVHHLSAKVPNYNLQRAHDENPIFRDVPVLTVRDGLRSPAQGDRPGERPPADLERGPGAPRRGAGGLFVASLLGPIGGLIRPSLPPTGSNICLVRW